MGQKVLFIASKKSFMVNAIMKNVAAGGFEVTFSEPRASWTEFADEAAGKPGVVLLFLEGGVAGVPEWSGTLEYFKEIARENAALRVFLIGSEAELVEGQAYFPAGVLSGSFLHPLNAKELVEMLVSTAASGMEEEMAAEKKSILVVDDDGTMLRTLKLWLSDRYRVFMANSGANAITLLEKNPVDLVLLDYEMPVANGPKVLEMIREHETLGDMPVMFLTARNDKESQQRVAGLEFECYLSKTQPPDELLAAIDGFFAKQ